MKIHLDSASNEIFSANNAQSPAGQSGSSAAANQVSVGNDHAELSMDHARVAAYAQQVNSLPEVRQEKVSALQDAISNNEYHVLPQQTADAMLAEFLGNVA